MESEMVIGHLLDGNPVWLGSLDPKYRQMIEQHALLVAENAKLKAENEALYRVNGRLICFMDLFMRTGKDLMETGKSELLESHLPPKAATLTNNER